MARTYLWPESAMSPISWIVVVTVDPVPAAVATYAGLLKPFAFTHVELSSLTCHDGVIVIDDVLTAITIFAESVPGITLFISTVLPAPTCGAAPVSTVEASAFCRFFTRLLKLMTEPQFVLIRQPKRLSRVTKPSYAS